MATSTNEQLKTRLHNFLADPRADKEFRPWFASLLIGPNSPEVDALVHAIHDAFSEAGEGRYTPEQLRTRLDELAKETASISSQTTAKFVAPGIPSTEQRQQVFAMDEGELVQV
ncbi:MAG TPA: hypothetical protein VK574_19600 [Terracidiphilus sp.]|nr:hypothetical protein [Terracidiphilus sp.]